MAIQTKLVVKYAKHFYLLLCLVLMVMECQVAATVSYVEVKESYKEVG